MRVTTIVFLVLVLIAAMGCGGGYGAPQLGSGITSNSGAGSHAISIFPTGEVTGGSDLILTVEGSNFDDKTHHQSWVVWSVNGTDIGLPTAFVSSTKITARIPAAFMIAPADAQVSVETGDPMGDVLSSKSNPASFKLVTPSSTMLSISSTSSSSATAGGPDLALTITGANFTDAPHRINRVVWTDANGKDTLLQGTFDSSSQITVVIPAALLSAPVTAYMRVEIWDSQGDAPLSTSNSLSFVVQ